MWKKRIRSVLSLVFVFVAGIAYPQEINLSDLINRALAENYRLQIFRNFEQMAENQNTLGNAGFLPNVNVRADQVWGIQNTEQRFFSGDVRSGSAARNTRLDAAVEVDWTIFDGFRMFAQRDRLSSLQELSVLDTRFYIEQTVADVAEMYYQLVMEKLVLSSLQKSLDISAFRLKLEEQKRNVGTGNALLYHQALIDFNTDSAQVVNRNRVIRDIEIRINRIIADSPDQNIWPLATAIDLHGFDDPDILLQKIIGNNTDLERSRLEELLAESNTRIERAARYPQISIFGNYSWASQANEVGFIESSRAYGGQYGVRVRFNLYSGGRQNTRIRNALLQEENASISASDLQLSTESHLAALLNSYNSYLDQYLLLESSLQAAQRSLTIAGEQLQAGAISGFDFRQAQLTALRVENQIIGLQFSLKAIELNIYRLSGELLNRIG